MLIHDVEQGTDEWHRLRAGIPTASEFKNLVTPTGKKSTSIKSYALTLAAEEFAGTQVDPFMGNQFTERGHVYEEDARAYYEVVNDLDAERVGFITDDDITVGCSPDSLVGEAGLLEIKSLMAPAHMKALEFLHKGVCPPDYFIQVQGQIMICEREWCDLLFYHPQLPKRHIRVFPDQTAMDLLADQLDELATLRRAAMAILTDKEAA